eukprot:TRINITY_DN4244_c0_g1_i1.p1 TRINITY_DN4244_c0_g1~~TRINITY_DN4244_c0_g1_i1.p1  ORF type:complete len:745 (+),score=98.21 TRINITY_DN4244_c0_g1_i1:185-2419(+)
MVSLTRLPCSKEDVGSAICRISTAAFGALELKPSDVVVVSDGAQVFLCRAYPFVQEFSEDVHHIQFDDYMSKYRSRPPPASQCSGDCVLVTKVNSRPEEAKEVSVEILVARSSSSSSSSSSLAKTCPQFESYRQVKWHSLVRASLLQYPVACNYAVSVKLPSTILDGTLELSATFVVRRVQPSRASVYVSRATKLNILGIRYADGAKQMQSTSSAHNDCPTSVSSLSETVGGLDSHMQSLRELIVFPFRYPKELDILGVECPKGILLKGLPGVGKTLMVRSIAAECGARLVSIDAGRIYASYMGDSESRLRTAFAEAQGGSSPCILFIDEIDALCAKRDNIQSHESRVVAQLLTLMDGMASRGRVVVIGATNRPNSIDPALRRPGRFDREIDVPVPDPAQREAIFLKCTKLLPLGDDVDLKALAHQCNGYVGADLAAVCREAGLGAIRRSHIAKNETDLRVSFADFESALSVVGPSAQRGSVVAFEPTPWEAIGGLDNVKKRIREIAEWPITHPESFKALGITPPRGLLLHGPPGCCKTTLVKALATNTASSLLTLTPASVFSPYVGSAESAIRECFKKARTLRPCIIFFDEVDALVGHRGIGDGSSGSSGPKERVLSTLLNELDGVESLSEVLVLAATNRPELLDPALLRPGRLEHQIHVPPPDTNEARRSIFAVHSRLMPVGEDVDLMELAQKTDGFTGADIENACREAALIALRENIEMERVMQRHFSQAIAVRSARRRSA